MRDPLTQALKEWAVVVDALAAGRQIVLLKKGGIAEETGTFEVAARDFVLFPTFEHQQPGSLIPEARAGLAGLAPPSPMDVTIHCVAEAADTYPITTLDTARALAPFHIWSEALVRQRFEQGPAPGLTALVLRVSRLPSPVTLPARDAYRGCKSWVRLDTAICTDQAVPVLSNEEFSQRRATLRRALPTPQQA